MITSGEWCWGTSFYHIGSHYGFLFFRCPTSFYNRPKKINAFENAIANQVEDIRTEGINPTAFWAYRRSEDAGNDLIDFSEVIWDEDIDPISETFRENDITEFTISSTFSGLIPTLAAFERHGFKMAGITEVNATYTDWQTGKRARIPAIRMVRG